jgi:hypothetical protein
MARYPHQARALAAVGTVVSIVLAFLPNGK